MHSVVGNLPGHSIPGRFLSTAKNPDGTYTKDAAASCMFILYKDGHLIQMYPVTASTWTSGGRDGNTRYWPVEAEGGAKPNTGEPLTKAAEDTFIRLVREWEAHTGRVAMPGVNLLQHKEIAALYGYASTSCASDRYNGALARLKEGALSQQDIERIDRLERLLAGHGSIPVTVTASNRGAITLASGQTPEMGSTVTLKGAQALAYLDYMGNNFWLGLASAQQTSAKALALAAGLGTAAGVFGAAAVQILGG